MQQQTIVIADDNADLRLLLHDTLSLDYTVYAAANGEEAIELLTQHDAHLVILDVEMPVTNGFEALRIIRDEDNWPTIPVIMLTVRKEPENALKAWGIGAEYYMTKPFSPALLLETVQKVLAETVTST